MQVLLRHVMSIDAEPPAVLGTDTLSKHEREAQNGRLEEVKVYTNDASESKGGVLTHAASQRSAKGSR